VWGAANSTDTVMRTYDLDGRLTSYPLGNRGQSGLVRTVVYDSASRITQYTHVNGSGVAQPTYNHTFNYDNLDRLTGWGQNTTAYGWGYDNSGNRTSYEPGSTTYTDTIASTSNWLMSTNGPTPNRSNTYDADGHLTADGTYTYTYSDRGRLASAKAGSSTVGYLYNALDQRVLKTGPTSIVSTGTQVYVYDESSHLLGEYSNSLAVVQETVFLGDAPIVVLTQTVSGSPATTTTNVYNVYTDQIGAPRVITQASSRKMAWRWDSADSYGVLAPNTNPAGLGTFAYNPRMPGQLFDAEDALFYNINRNYDPILGRYVQSDPIGLRAGINTYAYAGGNALTNFDSTGESVEWTGSLVGFGAAFIGGGSLYRFDFTSKCTCNIQVHIKGFASVLGLGVGIKGPIKGKLSDLGASGGGLTMYSPSDCPDPDDGNGRASIAGINVITGGGFSLGSAIQIGRLSNSELFSPGMAGWDVSISAMIGAAAVVNSEKHCC